MWKRPKLWWRRDWNDRLQDLIGPDGQVFVPKLQPPGVADGMLEVTLSAECQEEIGQETPSSREIPEEDSSAEQE